MKMINEMSEQEILKLEDEKAEKMIKYKMAEEGIKLFKKPIEPEYEEEKKKDLTYWRVENVEYLFVNKEDSETISKNLADLEDRMIIIRWGEQPKRLVADRDYSGNKREHFGVSSETFYSSEVYEEAQTVEKRNNNAKSIYDKQLEEYEKSFEASQYIRDEVWNRIFEVRNKYSEFERLNNLYTEYLVLSDNNTEIAWKFLKKSEIVTSEAEEYIQSVRCQNEMPS
jgi:hypothetical protein